MVPGRSLGETPQLITNGSDDFPFMETYCLRLRLKPI